MQDQTMIVMVSRLEERKHTVTTYTPTLSRYHAPLLLLPYHQPALLYCLPPPIHHPTQTAPLYIRLASSGCGWGDAANVEKWRGPKWAQTEYMRQEGWGVCVLGLHITFIVSFAGTLSPTKAFFVLMHALYLRIPVSLLA